MDALERIRSLIGGFAGYTEPSARRLSDERIRAFLGEALAQLPAAEIDALSAQARACYDRMLLHCEFVNQDAFRLFDGDPNPGRVQATLAADAEVLEAAAALTATNGAGLGSSLARLSDAFDKRTAAMQTA